MKVLYVDDEDDIREIAEMALSLEPDFDVRTSSSGPEAIRLATQWSPDLILLDVMMPGMDGPTTLANLQETMGGRLCPVVFCTARTQARDLEHYLSLGATGIIAKPFDPMGLAELVKRHAR